MKASNTEPAIKLQKEWFDDEVRCDFKISKEIKQCWMAQMEVLVEIDRICRKHNIMYYADWGTLLGTIRHKGFIPWDDDIDIGMKRADYTRFCKVASEELAEGFEYVNTQTGHIFSQLMARVINASEISLEESRLLRFHGCPYVVGVDIFPLDCLPKEKEDEEIMLELYRIVFCAIALNEAIINAEDGVVIDPASGQIMGSPYESQEALLQYIEELLNVKIERKEDMQKELRSLAERVGSLFTEDECEYLTSMPNYLSGWGGGTYLMKKEWYRDVIYMDFEGIFKMPVPVGYHEILTVLYGDYMTPKIGNYVHNYPFFNEQKDMLRTYLMEKGLTENEWDPWRKQYIEDVLNSREYW